MNTSASEPRDSDTEGEDFCFPLSLPQIEQVCYLSATGQSVKQIARRIGVSPSIVAPVVKGMRECNEIAAYEREKKSQWIRNEVSKAFCAPGPGIYNSKRRANGHIDRDQVRSAPGHIGGVLIAATP